MRSTFVLDLIAGTTGHGISVKIWISFDPYLVHRSETCALNLPGLLGSLSKWLQKKLVCIYVVLKCQNHQKTNHGPWVKSKLGIHYISLSIALYGGLSEKVYCTYPS